MNCEPRELRAHRKAMAEHPLARPPRPLAPPSDRDTATDAAAGQPIGPDEAAPYDPATKTVTRCCLIVWLILGVIVGTGSLIYWFFFAS